jgi:aspartyl-tRNA(Asn)/glutamyl-tRNA(Gln) amidotransferase subunit A
VSGAVEIAASVRAAETTATETIERALTTIEEHDGALHCFNVVAFEEARAAAAAVDEMVARGEDPGPLAGVPVALKDNLCTLGIPTTCSSRILEGWVPPYDATVVTRLRAAGAVVVGKTNLDEFAMGSSTENSAFGASHNPWDTGRVPGGSSGGSAAAVAAGIVPLALGTDTGGSIRQPAAFCGVVGAKPTYGRVSRYGLIAFASSLDQIGPFSCSVAEAALMLEVIGGHDPCDSTSIPEPMPALTGQLGRGVEGLRVGIVSDFLSVIAPYCAAAVEAVADALRADGAVVDKVDIPEVLHALPAYYLIAPAEASSNLARYDGVRYGLRVDGPDITSMYSRTRERGFGPEVKRRVMLGTYALSAGYYDAYYGHAQRVRTLVTRALDRAYGSFDVLLAPTTPSAAFRLGEKTADPLEMYMSDLCTIPSNLSGHPGISIPWSLAPSDVDAAGMPVGVQVLAPALAEGVMFRAAAAVERAADPAARGPVTPRVPEVAS